MGRAFEFRKERKMKRWGQMAKTFTKYFREIVMAVKENGADPEYNSRLRVIIQNAKADNMPKDNIERAIKKASEKGNTDDYKQVVYEGYAPHGVALLIETTTDNTTRTVANLRSYFNKLGGSLGTSGSVSYMFEHKCIFTVGRKPNLNLEELEFEMIDAGLEEIGEEENNLILYADFENFGNVQKFLEDQKFEIKSAKFERIPTDIKKITPEQEADVEKLLAKIEEDDDVQSVFHTMG
jgi:YebC/PmpR family DNA-binding regulatory protein